MSAPTYTQTDLAALLAERWPESILDEAAPEGTSDAEPTWYDLAEVERLADLARQEEDEAERREAARYAEQARRDAADRAEQERAENAAALRRWVRETRRRAVAPLARAEDPWQSSAACAGRADLTDATGGPKVAEALALCRSCPVIDQCRAWVAREPAFHGVAGGDLHGTSDRSLDRSLDASS